MVLAWYIKASVDELKQTPEKYISWETVEKQTGISYWKVDVNTVQGKIQLESIREKRGYCYEDTIEICEEKLPDFSDKIKQFYTEHFHPDEEVRYVLHGNGYFDVRDMQDDWIRIAVTRGDMISLPCGIHHRFTLDTKNYIKLLRLYTETPKWVAFNRPCENHPARKRYLEQLHQGFSF